MPPIKKTCRDHGGKFVPPRKAGRPPVRCDDGYRCTAYETAVTAPRHKPKSRAVADAVAAGTDVGPTAAQQQLQSTIAAADASREKAKQAKSLLVAKGWTVEGWGKGTRAELTAVRDEEMLIMVWDSGKLISSDYSLWAVDRPRANGAPPSQLPEGFNPDEATDREIIAALVGNKVTWWNRLGQKEESAIVSTTRLHIEHVYDEETLKHGAGPRQRILKFADREGGGFKNCYLDALIKIG